MKAVYQASDCLKSLSLTGSEKCRNNLPKTIFLRLWHFDKSKMSVGPVQASYNAMVAEELQLDGRADLGQLGRMAPAVGATPSIQPKGWS